MDSFFTSVDAKRIPFTLLAVGFGLDCDVRILVSGVTIDVRINSKKSASESGPCSSPSNCKYQSGIECSIEILAKIQRIAEFRRKPVLIKPWD